MNLVISGDAQPQVGDPDFETPSHITVGSLWVHALDAEGTEQLWAMGLKKKDQKEVPNRSQIVLDL